MLIKRIMAFVMIAVFTFLFPISVFADETETEFSEVEVIPENHANEEEENFTLVGRIQEFYAENKEQVTTAAGTMLSTGVSLAFGVVLLAFKKANKKVTDKIISQSDATVVSQKGVTASANAMVDAMNQMISREEERSKTEDARNKIALASFIMSKTTIEILQAVYPNSKNLPQGVKDIVNLKFANALKMMEDDNALAELSKTIKESMTENVNEGNEAS